MSSSSSASTPAAAASAPYSPFQRLMMQVIFQAQTDLTVHATWDQALDLASYGPYFERLLRVASISTAPAAVALEIVE